MKQLLFYEQPVALNKERHRSFKIDNKGANYSFAQGTNSVIITGMEFVHVAKEYPIVFAKAGERTIPLAMLGLRNDENLYVDAAGQWDARYIPAFVRRYPFVLADSGDGNLAVCIDEKFPGFNSESGTPLFTDEGEQAPLLENAIRFLKEYQGQNQRTEIFVNRLLEMELLTELTARAELAGGVKFSMGGLLVVDEKKLMELPQEKALELFRSGELGWIYAHLLSLSNMNRLAELLSKLGVDAGRVN
ncbi:SapC family protein [Candidatus Magnetaquicoccus inordinatus]|uniref:SapC family protein n=1 Tax=Candidatus Magnetaquicoccus inordinatus TaxID=2496818 RepID=UPI00102B5B05|nr:SapC family protein [Candidatus Magnetaquicoccus inordinatus]